MCKENMGMGSGCPMGGCHKGAKALGLLALRIALAIVFIKLGYLKLTAGHEMATSMMMGIGLPGSGSVWAYLVGGLEVLGGVMVLFGVFATYASAWLSIILVVALLTVHRSGTLVNAFLPIAMLGGTLAILGAGAGKYRLLKMECPCPMCKGKAVGGKDGGCCGGSCGGNCGNKTEPKM